MCYNPWTKYKAGSSHFIEKHGRKITYTADVNIPCGRCVRCKQRRVEDWVIRLEEEARDSVSSYFITLTYNNDNLLYANPNWTVSKKELQKFIRRLRRYDKLSTAPDKKNSEGKIIKYYGCGEYGGKTNRPHYHLIIYNITDIESVYKAWTYGHIHIGDSCNDATMAYTAKYIDKESPEPEGSEKKFSIMSKGLGKSWLTHERIEHHRSGDRIAYINRNGYQKALPRYYQKQIWNDAERAHINSDSQEHNREKAAKANREIKKIHKEDLHLFKAKLRRSQEKILASRSKLRN